MLSIQILIIMLAEGIVSEEINGIIKKGKVDTINRPEHEISFTGVVIGVGDKFDNDGASRCAVNIKVPAEIANTLKKYAPVTSVNGDIVTIFLSPKLAEKANIDGNVTISLERRLAGKTQYKDKNGSVKEHTKDGYAISGFPMFEESEKQKDIEIKKQKAKAYTSEDVLSSLTKLAKAGVNVNLDL